MKKEVHDVMRITLWQHFAK